MDIRWIFFDVGYTLINEDEVWERRFREQAQMEEARSLNLTPEIIRHEVEVSTIERKPQYRTFLNKYGFSFSAPYRHELEKPYPDALTVIRKLSQHYRLGIIANQSDGLAKRLEAWGFLPYLTTVISSWDYQITKPDLRLFEAALTESRCCTQEAVMVGDRLDNDILPANSLGMRTVRVLQGFGSLQKPLTPMETPDHEIRSLSELLTLFG